MIQPFDMSVEKWNEMCGIWLWFISWSRWRNFFIWFNDLCNGVWWKLNADKVKEMRLCDSSRLTHIIFVLLTQMDTQFLDFTHILDYLRAKNFIGCTMLPQFVKVSNARKEFVQIFLHILLRMISIKNYTSFWQTRAINMIMS